MFIGHVFICPFLFTFIVVVFFFSAENANCDTVRCKDRQVCLSDLVTHRPRCVSCSFKCPRRKRPQVRFFVCFYRFFLFSKKYMSFSLARCVYKILKNGIDIFRIFNVVFLCMRMCRVNSRRSLKSAA